MTFIFSCSNVLIKQSICNVPEGIRAPGSFLILKGCSFVVFQLLEVTTDTPEELFERSALNPTFHILKLSAYEHSHSLPGINIAQLRQRSVKDL